MTRFIAKLVALALLAGLAACAPHRELRSPCACDPTPINQEIFS